MTQLVNEQDTPVIAKTKELCEALIAQDSYKALKAKFDAFVADQEAQLMYQALSEHQSRLVNKQEQGETLSEAEIQDFENKREQLLMHPVAGGFVEAQQGFEELRETVVNYVTKTFELGRLPTDEELKPKGGCCGGGGGGCGCGSGGCS